MAIVFNQEGLSAIQPPCVVQNFINHNAVLYKVFVVGESYTVVQRPSLKNFSAGTSGNPLPLILSEPNPGAELRWRPSVCLLLVLVISWLGRDDPS